MITSSTSAGSTLARSSAALNGDLAKGMGRQARKRAVEGANGRPRRADDDNLFLFHTRRLHFPRGPKVIT